MIHEINITDPAKVPVKWWPQVKALQTRTKFTFTPGLNVIFAPNGSGKSTLLLALAKLFHCQQGRVPTVTAHSLQELGDESAGGMTVRHDGEPVFYFDPNERPGLIGGMTGFDYDFGTEGMINAMQKGSSGELIFNGIGRLMEKAAKSKGVEWKVVREEVSDYYQSKLDAVETFLKPTEGLQKGPATLLLDEPDRSLAVVLQAKLWAGLANIAGKSKKVPKHYQIIAASHSPFALGSGAHFIELEDGYVESARTSVALLGLELLPPK